MYTNLDPFLYLSDDSQSLQISGLFSNGKLKDSQLNSMILIFFEDLESIASQMEECIIEESIEKLVNGKNHKYLILVSSIYYQTLQLFAKHTNIVKLVNCIEICLEICKFIIAMQSTASLEISFCFQCLFVFLCDNIQSKVITSCWILTFRKYKISFKNLSPLVVQVAIQSLSSLLDKFSILPSCNCQQFHYVENLTIRFFRFVVLDFPKDRTKRSHCIF
jgi:hypothetical protein